MNKSLITNAIALLLAVSGYFCNDIIFAIGIFALSGAITNWLAVYMLFEKIPFVYGSGVIPSRFEDFKEGIKRLIIEEFFNKEHIEKFFQENAAVMSYDKVNDKIDFNKIFEGLVDAIIASPLGGMLAMFGGKEALNPLREPIIAKLKEIIQQLMEQQSQNPEHNLANNIITQIEVIIDNRLAQLTPQMVKEIIQKMIRKHLGWLVVWGGVFGGVIGLFYAVV